MPDEVGIDALAGRAEPPARGVGEQVARGDERQRRPERFRTGGDERSDNAAEQQPAGEGEDEPARDADRGSGRVDEKDDDEGFDVMLVPELQQRVAVREESGRGKVFRCGEQHGCDERPDEECGDQRSGEVEARQRRIAKGSRGAGRRTAAAAECGGSARTRDRTIRHSSVRRSVQWKSRERVGSAPSIGVKSTRRPASTCTTLPSRSTFP